MSHTELKELKRTLCGLLSKQVIRPSTSSNRAPTTLHGRKIDVLVTINQTCSFRGSKSRNKVSVGDPVEGSLTHLNQFWIDLLITNIN